MTERLLYTAAAAFESARSLPGLPAAHRARRLHGHGFVARLRAQLPAGFAAFPGGEAAELGRRLRERVAPLDYELLDARIETPTDENIARWIRAGLDLPGLEAIGVRSAAGRGVDLDRDGAAHPWRRYAFQAAHRLPNVPRGHKCGRMHGHGFGVVVHAKPGIDHDRLDEVMRPVLDDLDFRCLNDVAGLENPTSELISGWIWNRVRAALPELAWVTVHETASCGAHFDGARYRIWKDATLDSAVRLRRAPAGHPAGRLHGHTYALRLHLSAGLDQVMGWTVDFGDVKELFAPVFEALDHQPLHEIGGLQDNDLATLLRWIRQQATAALPALDRVDLHETHGAGAILSWGDAPPALPL